MFTKDFIMNMDHIQKHNVFTLLNVIRTERRKMSHLE